MTLVRFRPFYEMEDIRRQMNRLFEDMVVPSQGSEKDRYSFSPAIEFNETEEAYHVSLEVPGVNPDDVNIEASRESIAISGERRTESSSNSEESAKSEFRYGKFRRVIPLPGRIDHQNISADCKNGVALLTLPKAEEERNRVVKVSLASNAS